MLDITIQDTKGNTINKRVFGWEIKDHVIYLFNKSGQRVSAYPCIWHRVDNVEGDFEKSIK